MKARNPCLPLLQRKECLVPTWRGWLVLLFTFAIVSAVAIRGAYGFLAPNDPLPGGLLVVEGWASDQIMASTLDEYRRNHYEGVLTTGGPVELGGALHNYKTYADLGRATLIQMGMNPDVPKAVPAEAVVRDRTHASATALKKWLREHGVVAQKINIMGSGAHSRRTRLIYEKAFQGNMKIGITTSRELEFDPKRWWTSSQGVRIVLGESIAYLYARLFFWPAKE